MKQRHYKTILYFIATMIVATLAMQGYWSYKNYQASKQQLANDIQESLDNAVESYYTNMAQESIIGITLKQDFDINEKGINDLDINQLLEQMKSLDSLTAYDKDNVSINVDATKGIKEIAIFANSDTANIDTLVGRLNTTSNLRHSITKWNSSQDSTYLNAITALTSKVIYGLQTDTLNTKLIDSIFKESINKKGITITHELRLQHKDSLSNKNSTAQFSSETISTQASTDFLPPLLGLQLNYKDFTGTLLRRNVVSIVFSLLFVMAIILSLLYLLKIIQNQKQLAEVKNDLISNITHEFKTPLATIAAAMEGIQVFNASNDTEKTLKYANISSNQVDKLSTMVEKLLETATLESDKLALNPETIDLVQLVDTISKKETFVNHEKQIEFTSTISSLSYAVDPFHFENAINNILDNAIKYGGNHITIQLKKISEAIIITINDNGNTLTKAQSKQIFEKFYRVPKGNTHDVKGFGIGLFYTRAIIEKHHGTITVTTAPTTFKISLPYAS